VPKRSMRHDELLKRLKRYGIIEMKHRAKGSERMLYQESTRNNYPIKYHGKNTEYSIAVLKNIKRKFDLPKEFLE
jgi:hypothetical protein